MSFYFIDNRVYLSLFTIYVFLITYLSLIGVDNKEKATLILTGKPLYEVIYNYESKMIKTDSTFLFIGKTSNYLFFRDSSDSSNSIVKIENIKNLKIRKLKR